MQRQYLILTKFGEKGFELFRTKKVYGSICRLSYNFMAGGESDGWHPLVEDFIIAATKLEKLGFIYDNGKVIVTEVSDVC